MKHRLPEAVKAEHYHLDAPWWIRYPLAILILAMLSGVCFGATILLGSWAR